MKASLFIKKELVIWLIILTPFVFAMVNWDKLPDRIPIHWDIDGNPNGYSDKGPGLLVMPLVSIGLYFLLLLLPKIDPKKSNYLQFEGTYRIIRFAVHIILSTAFLIGLMSPFNTGINSARLGNLLVSGLFLLLGNFMGKIRPNYFVGIRTPWTLANEDVWVKTHRATGRVWVAASFIFLAISLFAQLPHGVHYAYFGILVIYPFIYSYVKYREVTTKQNHTDKG